MQLYPFTIPNFASSLFPSLTWRINKPKGKQIFLTFDDGPQPEVTEWVLKTLEAYKAKASFFVVGENVLKYPQVFEKVKEEGHAIGNHTQHHISGYSAHLETYLADIAACQKNTQSNLFRPPYGRIRPSQTKALKGKYQIIMWNQLSGDFDKNLNRKKSLASLCKNAKAGNIVVFHDSMKSLDNLKEILPPFLAYLSQEGFICSALPSHEYLDN